MARSLPPPARSVPRQGGAVARRHHHHHRLSVSSTCTCRRAGQGTPYLKRPSPPLRPIRQSHTPSPSATATAIAGALYTLRVGTRDVAAKICPSTALPCSTAARAPLCRHPRFQSCCPLHPCGCLCLTWHKEGQGKVVSIFVCCCLHVIRLQKHYSLQHTTISTAHSLISEQQPPNAQHCPCAAIPVRPCPEQVFARRFPRGPELTLCARASSGPRACTGWPHRNLAASQPQTSFGASSALHHRANVHSAASRNQGKRVDGRQCGDCGMKPCWPELAACDHGVLPC